MSVNGLCQRNSGFYSLRIGKGMTHGQILTTLHQAKDIQRLTEVDLISVALTKQQATLLAEVLSNQKDLALTTFFHCSGRSINIVVASAVLHSKHLQIIDCSSIREGYINTIGSALVSNENSRRQVKLASLRIYNEQFPNSNSTLAIAKGLASSNHSLRELVFTGCMFDDITDETNSLSSLEALAYTLRDCTSLESLTLDGCALSSDQLVTLADAMRHMPSISALSLSVNYCSAVAAKAIASLLSGKQMTNLRLVGSGTANAIQIILDSILEQTNTSLRMVALPGMKLTDQQLVQWAHRIRQPSSRLERVYIRHRCCFGRNAITTGTMSPPTTWLEPFLLLLSAVETNSTLTDLEISEPIVRRVADVDPDLARILRLILFYTTMNKEGLKRLLKQSIPPALWPFILESSYHKLLYHYLSTSYSKHLLNRQVDGFCMVVSTQYFLLRNGPILLSWR